MTCRSPALGAAALSTCVAVMMVHSVRFLDAKDILANTDAERRRYLDAGHYLESVLPAEAIVLAMQHSGSVRYYTGRLTMRWDVLEAGRLDTAVAALQARGVPVFALLESWEEEDFRRRFASQRTVEALESGLMARGPDGELRLYALSSRAANGGVAIIPVTSSSGCVDVSPRFIAPLAYSKLAGPRSVP
jgi:hypothetical protein